MPRTTDRRSPIAALVVARASLTSCCAFSGSVSRIESAVYFAVAECLANVVRHSGAEHAWIRLSHADGVLSALVGDDGRGGADPQAGTGMLGVMRRLAAFDGTMRVSSPAGGPTVVTLEVPCVLSSPKTTPSSGPA